MDDLDALLRKQSLLTGWLGDYQQRTEYLPFVEKSLEVTKYQIDVAQHLPLSLPPATGREIVGSFAQTVPFWESFAKNTTGTYAFASPVTGLALEASGSNVSYQSISALTVGHSKEVTDWAREKTVNYQVLMKKQDREKTLRDEITALFPARLDEFDTAVASFSEAVTQSHPQVAWGIHARNLLEHVKGDLFVIAQKILRKQKVKWAEFADALAKRGIGSPEHAGLVAEESNYRVLHSALTDLAKNLIQLPEPDLRDRRTEFDEHLFAVLTLVDEAKIAANR
jgi:hypothetical protein